MEFYLMGFMAFAFPCVMQLGLLFVVRKVPFRWAGLLFPILFFVLALASLTVDESRSFISLKEFVATVLASAGLLSLSGCGAAWVIWKTLLGGRYWK